MISVAVFAILGGALATVISNAMASERKTKVRLALGEFHQEMQQSVLRSNDWAATVAHEPQMACFAGSSPSSCSALKNKSALPLKLYAASGRLVFDSSAASAGLTITGAPCNSYGTSSDCIIKPMLTWRVECNDSADPTCLSPLAIVDLRFTTTDDSLKWINFENYGFHLANATFPLASQEACTGSVPSCSSSQAAICQAGAWTCQEFGL